MSQSSIQMSLQKKRSMELERTTELARLSKSKPPLVAFSDGTSTKVVKLDEFVDMLHGRAQFEANGDQTPFFTCCLIDDTAGGRGIDIPTHILNAMKSVASGLQGGTELHEESVENGCHSCCGAGSVGETLFGAVKGVLKVIGKVYKVSDLLAGAFGPSSTRQKLERCLTEVGCLLIVLSLFFALALAANAKFYPKPYPILSHNWSSVMACSCAHCSYFVWWVDGEARK